MRVTKLFCGILFLPYLCLSQNSGSKQFLDEGSVSKSTFDFESKTYIELKNKNIMRANEILNRLYSETAEDFAGTPNDPNDELIVGSQAGYYAKSGTEQARGPLVIYGRTWTYDAGMALSLAVKNEDPTAYKRVLWLRKNAQDIVNPQNSKDILFAGWPFSKNQLYLGDSWTDRRFITGANAIALKGIADFITSGLYKELGEEEQDYCRSFFGKALKGILYHVESNGPNEGLISAGWTLNVLKEFYKTGQSYSEILSLVGYEARTIEGYPYLLKIIRARNIVTEHCINVLDLLNQTLDHYDILFGSDPTFSYDELTVIRLKLRKGIFSKLYDKNKGCFITGRSESGVSSQYTAISNASWLCLVLKLDELKKSQVEILSKSLLYTVNNFTKDFVMNNEAYFGAHYFQDGFEDPYISKADTHADVLHIEGTCGLINSLLTFTNAFPDDPNAPVLHTTALKLWQSLQYLINDYGFIYASTSLKDVTEPLESSVSAIWYLQTCNYFDTNPVQ